MSDDLDKYVKVYHQMIRPGVPLAMPLYTIHGELLASKGVALDERQIIVILQHGAIYTTRDGLIQALNEDSVTEPVTDMEIQDCPDIFTQLEQLTAQLYSVYRLGPDGFVSHIEKIAIRLLNIVRRRPEAAVAYVMTNRHKDFLSHGICCAVFTVLVLDQLEWKRAERNSLLHAALTMDISLVTDDKEHSSLPKGDKFYKHQVLSKGVLSGLGVTDEKWLAYVEHHHAEESPDRDPEDKLPWGCYILALCDVFRAQLLGMNDDKQRPPDEIIASLKTVYNRSMAGLSLNALISAIGIYPYGSIVLLANKEIGVVSGKGKSDDTPLVKVFFAADGNHWRSPVARKTEVPSYAIKSVLPLENFFEKIDFRQIWH